MPTRRTRGYTLVEMVLVLTVLTLVGGTAGFVTLQSMKAYARTMPALDNAYQVRSCLARMMREIRALRERNSITAMTANTLTFADSSGTIAYAVSGGNLTRNGDLAAKGVTSLTFNYWKSDGTAATAASNVHFIEVDLTVENLGKPYRLQTAVFPRVCAHD